MTAGPLGPISSEIGHCFLGTIHVVYLQAMGFFIRGQAGLFFSRLVLGRGLKPPNRENLRKKRGAPLSKARVVPTTSFRVRSRDTRKKQQQPKNATPVEARVICTFFQIISLCT